MRNFYGETPNFLKRYSPDTANSIISLHVSILNYLKPIYNDTRDPKTLADTLKIFNWFFPKNKTFVVLNFSISETK